LSVRLKVEDLIKIDIHRTVLAGYCERRVGEYRLRFSTEMVGNDYCLVLDVNSVQVPMHWTLCSMTIRGRLRNGGRIPWDRNEIWYVVGDHNKRYKFLYINLNTFRIGTRDGLGARHRSNCMSRRQQIRYRQYLRLKREMHR
jgi:hypothetical protein